MEKKVLTISCIIVALFISSSLLMMPVHSIPTNKIECNACHNADGLGSLSSTLLDGSRPVNNTFIITRPEYSSITLHGIGANEETEPGIALIFDPQIFHHIIMSGALPGGEDSYAFYVQDGDLNDNDPEPGNVKGVFQISVDPSAHLGIFSITAVYLQEGPTGITVDLILNVEGNERKTGSISLLVSPILTYVNKELVYISGSIRPSEAANVILEYKISNDWQALANLLVGGDGTFFHEWQPSEIEDYSIRVRFEGDENYDPVISDMFSVSVQELPQSVNNLITNALLLAMTVLIIGSSLFYLAGRSRYNKRLASIRS